MGGCNGRPPVGSGRCPFGAGKREGDTFCPCERIRVCKLLALTAFGGVRGTPPNALSGTQIQYSVGALCVADFVCGFPAVNRVLRRVGCVLPTKTLDRMMRWLNEAIAREAAVGAASGAVAGAMKGGRGPAAGAATGAVAGIVASVVQHVLTMK